MAETFILALDQGTTSCRAILFNREGRVQAMEQEEFTQIFPEAGWVEHDAEEIWDTQLRVTQNLLKKEGVQAEQLAGIGITNQRETTVVWNKKTGKPVYNAIVWQDKRTKDLCRQLETEGHGETIRSRSGLVLDAYFSGTKIMWILENVPGVRKKAAAGELLFGTIDSWLVWKLTEGRVHATDFTNASRTLLFNIVTQEWDKEIADIMNIPESMFPNVLPSSGSFGETGLFGGAVKIAGIAGDQQAAMFGQQCVQPGDVKNTYGTGCFMLMNTGRERKVSANGLLTTICCGPSGEVNYALEGSIFIAGAAIQWLRDGLELITSARDTEALAVQAEDKEEVFVVPAFAGLGAPYWDMDARGAIFGLSRETDKAQVVKATLESIAYQTKDVLVAMEKDAGMALASLKVDGGACANNYLMQFQADILQGQVLRPEIIESTALGAAYLAGLSAGYWSKEELTRKNPVEKIFTPLRTAENTDKLYATWQKAVKRTLNWLNN